MNKVSDDIFLGIGLVCIVLIVTITGMTIVIRNNEYCQIEENKNEWNCLTEKDIKNYINE